MFLVSGLVEPLGALAGYLFFGWLNNDLLLGLVVASDGGIMIYICLGELFPAAQKTGARQNLMNGLCCCVQAPSWGLLCRHWTLCADTDLFFLDRHTKDMNGPNNLLVDGIKHKG